MVNTTTAKCRQAIRTNAANLSHGKCLPHTPNFDTLLLAIMKNQATEKGCVDTGDKVS